MEWGIVMLIRCWTLPTPLCNSTVDPSSLEGCKILVTVRLLQSGVSGRWPTWWREQAFSSQFSTGTGSPAWSVFPCGPNRAWRRRGTRRTTSAPATAASAPTRKQSRKAVSSGIAAPPRSIVLLVRIAAITAPASVVPTDRMSALTPTPEAASAAGGVVHNQRGHRCIGDADTRGRDDASDHELPWGVHEENGNDVACGDDDCTDGQGHSGAEPGDHGARDRGEQHHHQSTGGHPEPGREDGLAQSIAGGLRHLQ